MKISAYLSLVFGQHTEDLYNYFSQSGPLQLALASSWNISKISALQTFLFKLGNFLIKLAGHTAWFLTVTYNFI